MTLIEAITKAESLGFKWKVNCKDTEVLLDIEFWKRLCSSLGYTVTKIRMCMGCGVALRENEKEDADGKHGGKNGCGSDVYEFDGQWLIEMHRFIDHLADGKDISSFFKNMVE